MDKIFYHGTSGSYLQSIKDYGLKPTPDFTYPNSPIYGIPIVQLADNPTAAKWYAIMRCYGKKIYEYMERLFEGGHFLVGKMNSIGGKPILITIKLPEIYTNKLSDDFTNKEYYTFFPLKKEIIKIELIQETIQQVAKDVINNRTFVSWLALEIEKIGFMKKGITATTDMFELIANSGIMGKNKKHS